MDQWDMDKNKLISINRQWLEQKYRELKEREKKIKQLAEECRLIRLEMDPLEQWLVQMEGQEIVDELKSSGAEPVPEPADEAQAGGAAADESEPGIELKGDSLRNEVMALLRRAYPGMLYYREILQCLEDMGYQVGGKDPGLNLIAHISTDKRIVRGNKRGMYGLSEDFARELNLIKE